MSANKCRNNYLLVSHLLLFLLAKKTFFNWNRCKIVAKAIGTIWQSPQTRMNTGFFDTSKPVIITPTRRIGLYSKQFCLESVMPILLIVLIIRIIRPIRWFVIILLSRLITIEIVVWLYSIILNGFAASKAQCFAQICRWVFIFKSVIILHD